MAMSRGRNARAIRAKYRLGGAILSLLAIVSCSTGCGNGEGMMTCYDPVTGHNYITAPENLQSAKLRNGDVLIFKGYCNFPTKATLTLLDKADKELQHKEYTLESVYEEFDLEFEVEVGDYRGIATLRIVYDSDLFGKDITSHSEDIDVSIVN